MAKGKLPEGIIWRTINGARVAINPKTGMAVAGAGGRLKGVTLNWYDDMGPMPSHLRGASKPAPARPSKSMSLEQYKQSQRKAAAIIAARQETYTPERVDQIVADAEAMLRTVSRESGMIRSDPNASGSFAPAGPEIRAIKRMAQDIKDGWEPGAKSASAEQLKEMSARLDTAIQKARVNWQDSERAQLQQRVERIQQGKSTSPAIVQPDMPKPKVSARKKFADAATRRRRAQQAQERDARGPRTGTRMVVDGRDAYITRNAKSGVEITMSDGRVYKGKSVSEIAKNLGVKIDPSTRRKSKESYNAAKANAKATGGRGKGTPETDRFFGRKAPEPKSSGGATNGPVLARDKDGYSYPGIRTGRSGKSSAEIPSVKSALASAPPGVSRQLRSFPGAAEWFSEMGMKLGDHGEKLGRAIRGTDNMASADTVLGTLMRNGYVKRSAKPDKAGMSTSQKVFNVNKQPTNTHYFFTPTEKGQKLAAALEKAFQADGA